MSEKCAHWLTKSHSMDMARPSGWVSALPPAHQDDERYRLCGRSEAEHECQDTPHEASRCGLVLLGHEFTT